MPPQRLKTNNDSSWMALAGVDAGEKMLGVSCTGPNTGIFGLATLTKKLATPPITFSAAPPTLVRGPTARVLPMPGGRCALPQPGIHERKSNIARIHDPARCDASRLTVIVGRWPFFQLT